MIKLIAIDIDGTLLNDNHQITEPVRLAISQAKKAGAKVVITTGRPLKGVEPILSELGLEEPGDYVITYNGALVQKTDTGEALISESLTYDDFLDIEMTARKLGTHVHALTMDGIYTPNRNIGKYTVNEAYLVNMPIYYRTPEEMGEFDFVKMMYIDEPAILDPVIEGLPERFSEKYTLVKSAPYYLEILNKRASKGKAVLHLADKLNIQIDEIMAIGDQENDRAMLEVAGLPVVMENGNPELKKIAKFITKSNNEHGVAHAINKFVLDKEV